MVDTNALLRHYSTLPDERLFELALYEGKDLQPAALQILKTEIQRRGLPERLTEAVELHERGVSADERVQITDWLRRQPCPMCGRAENLLNAIELESVTSYLVVSHVESSLIIACAECIDRETTRVQETQGLGRLSPGGFIRTINAEASNVLALEEAKGKGPSTALLQYVDHNLIPLYLLMKDGQSPFTATP